MTTALTTGLPAPTPELTKSLSPQDLQDHRARIAFEVETVLSAYFQPHEDERIKASQLSWWCDELQDWTAEQVVWALRKWNSENPSRRPTPGHIVAICKAERGGKYAASVKPTKPQDPQPVSKEAAQEILKNAGFKVNRFGGVE